MDESLDLKRQFLEEQRQEMLKTHPLSLSTIRLNELERELNQHIQIRIELGEDAEIATEQAILELTGKKQHPSIQYPEETRSVHSTRAILPTVLLLGIIGHFLVLLMQGLVFGFRILTTEYIRPTDHLIIFTLAIVSSAVLTLVYRSSKDDRSYLTNFFKLVTASFVFAFLWKGISNLLIAAQLLGIPFFIAGYVTPTIHRLVQKYFGNRA